MSIKTIKEFDSGESTLSGDDLFLIMDDPSGSAVTKNVSLNNLLDTVSGTNIHSLGTVSGTVNIDYSTNKQIQKLTVNGATVTLNKGTGWPSGDISRDVVLSINCVSSTTIIWNIVGSNWYNKPTSILAGGEYLVLLRSTSSGVIEGHYIGEKQGSL
jgi:hypothetical protein